jgi:hypothetical protein
MTVLSHTDINTAKAEGQYRRAGQLAALLGCDSSYGCHFGMRSTLAAAREQFAQGYTEVSLLADRDLLVSPRSM